MNPRSLQFAVLPCFDLLIFKPLVMSFKMRCLYLLIVFFVSSLSCLAQDGERILDEVEDERIADEAEDLELVAEFEELEQQVAHPWMMLPKFGGDDGELVPFHPAPDGSLIALWPFLAPGCAVAETYTVPVPFTEQIEKPVTRTIMKNETRSRIVSLTKTRAETRTRLIEVEKVREDGTTVTETQEQIYTVMVPYTEEIEQTYTVCIPVQVTEMVTVELTKVAMECRTKTVPVDCVTLEEVRIQPGKFPLFRGDRRPADWEEFQADVSSAGELYVAFFGTEMDWKEDWDSVFDADAYVVILDQVKELPEKLHGDSKGNPCDGFFEPLPALGRRSNQPDHQFAFSPYVQVPSRRPGCVGRPVLFSEWFAGNPIMDDLAMRSWVYELEFVERNWTAVEGRQLTRLEVEQTLSAGKSFIVAHENPNRSAWNDVLDPQVPVYASIEPDAQNAVEEQDISREIEISLAAKEALRQGDGVAVIALASQVPSSELLDVNFWCQAAYLLHRQGSKGMGEAFIAHALELDPSPIHRKQLVRQQGNSRLWLEQTVQDRPMQLAGKDELNRSRMDRLSAIYNRVMRGRELSEEQLQLLRSKTMEAAPPQSTEGLPAPEVAPVSKAVPAPEVVEPTQ